MRAGWTKSYYDMMEDYYWEPQLLRKITKKRGGTIEDFRKTIQRLGTLEITLNHQLEIFFRLAPSSFIRDFFKATLAGEFTDDYDLLGHELAARFKTHDAIQPDLYFLGTNSSVAIELKVRAKSSTGQVAKYALLDVLVNRTEPENRFSALLFMGPKAFPDLWRERFRSPEDLIEATRASDLQTYARPHGVTPEELIKTLSRMSIAFASYQNFAVCLSRARAEIDRSSPYAQTYDALLAGMLYELAARKLVKVPPPQPVAARPALVDPSSA